MPTPESIQLLSVVIVFALLLLSFFNPFYGLLSYFAVMMTRIGLYFPVLATARIELVIALIVLIETIVLQKGLANLSLKYNPVCKYLLCFFVVMLLSYLQAWDYEHSWNFIIIEFIRVYIFVILVVALVRTQQEVFILLFLFSALTLITGYEGLYLHLNETSTYTFHEVDVSIATKGMAASHVAAANLQVQCLPITVFLMFGIRSIVLKATLCLFAVSSVITIVASGSRGGFLGLIVFGIVTIAFSENRVRALIISIIVCVIALPLMPGDYMSWMGSITSHADDSAASRIDGLITGFDIMLRRPILGVGPGCYPFARKAWFGWGLESHNQFGQMMGDLGILGTIVWPLFMYHVFKNLKNAKQLFRSNAPDQKGMLFLITGIQVALIVRLFEGNFSQSLYIFFWYLMAGLSIVVLKNAEQDNQNKPKQSLTSKIIKQEK